MKKGITAHFMVRNEENFIRNAIESVSGIADEIIVFDTGSTDKTPEIVKDMKGKIRFFEKGIKTPKELIALRNEMVELTKTNWFFVVDGDEIFYFNEEKKLLNQLDLLPESILRVEVTIRDFVRDANLVARNRVSGKIWRTDRIRFFGEYPFEGGFPKENPKADFKSFSSGELKDDIVCYHMVFFERSSKDKDVEVGRHWRKIPFPVLPFFGIYPKEFRLKQNFLLLIPKLLYYNIIGFLHLFFHRKEQRRNAKRN